MADLTYRQRITSLTLAGVLVVLLIGGLTWLLLSPGSDSTTADEPLPSTSTTELTFPEPAEATTTTTITGPRDDVATETTMYADGMGGEDGDYYMRPGEGLPLPPMGMVATTLDWDVIELSDLPEHDVWINQVFELNGVLFASGGAWDDGAERERPFLWQSADGTTWTRVELLATLIEAGASQFIATDDQVVAFANQWDERSMRPTPRVFLSGDGLAWTEVDLSAFTSETENMWLWHAASNGDTLLLAGNREPHFEPPPPYEEPVITIHKDGKTLELDGATWSFLITDDATGEVLLHGSQEMIWQHDWENGDQVIWNEETGEAVFRLNWERPGRAGIEAYESVTFGGGFVIEYEADGKLLTIDQFDGSFTVTEAASGAVIMTGSEEDMWRGRPPTFIDPHTGEVVLAVTWDEWEAAHEAAWQPYESDWENDYWSRPVLLVSGDDGATFTEVDLTVAGGENFNLSSFTGGPQGYLVLGYVQEDWAYEGEMSYGPDLIVLRSDDGYEWSNLGVALEGWSHNVTATPDGYAASFSEDGSGAVMTSTDGISWSPILTVEDLQLPLGSAWFDRIATGGFGTIVTGTRDGWEPGGEAAIRSISKQGRTLTIEGPHYELVEDSTGAVIFDFDEELFWMEHEWVEDEEPPFTGLRWGQGGVAIFSEDGTLLFAVSHDEMWGDQEGDYREPDEWYETEPLLLLDQGSGFASVELPEEIDGYAWFSGVVVGDDRVVVAATVDDYAADEWSQRIMILVGR